MADEKRTFYSSYTLHERSLLLNVDTIGETPSRPQIRFTLHTLEELDSMITALTTKRGEIKALLDTQAQYRGQRREENA